MFGAEPYMSEAAYRAELARGRIHLEDIDAVLDGEPDAVVFPRLSRRSLRRAMMTPGVREFDAATILWRSEQGDLAKDFRQPALRLLFDACLARDGRPRGRARAGESSGRDHPSVADPVVLRCFWIRAWRIGPCRIASRASMRASGPCCLNRGVFPRYLTGLDEEFRRQERMAFSAADAVLDYLDSARISMKPNGKASFETELLALPGWAGLMRRLEEDPGLAPHESVPASLMDFLAVRLTMARVASRMGGQLRPSPRRARSRPRRNGV